jgi:hypothetical protein
MKSVNDAQLEGSQLTGLSRLLEMLKRQSYRFLLGLVRP